MQLLKFARPGNKEVQVTYSVEMTESWFEKQVNRVNEEIEKVMKASHRLTDQPMRHV